MARFALVRSMFLFDPGRIRCIFGKKFITRIYNWFVNVASIDRSLTLPPLVCLSLDRSAIGLNANTVRSSCVR